MRQVLRLLAEQARMAVNANRSPLDGVAA
jgi:hypothetical protein